MKKALNITIRILAILLTVLILLFAVAVMIFTVISVNTVGREDASLFGYKPYIVLSDSMQDTFAVGDMAVSKAADVSTLEPGDIITFTSIDPANYGETVTHKIREITTYEGEPAFITYGTTTGVDDAYPVPFANVNGEYQFRLPGMGYFLEFLHNPAGYVALILVFVLLLLILLALLILQVVFFAKRMGQYRREQRTEHVVAENTGEEW